MGMPVQEEAGFPRFFGDFRQTRWLVPWESLYQNQHLGRMVIPPRGTSSSLMEFFGCGRWRALGDGGRHKVAQSGLRIEALDSPPPSSSSPMPPTPPMTPTAPVTALRAHLAAPLSRALTLTGATNRLGFLLETTSIWAVTKLL